MTTKFDLSAVRPPNLILSALPGDEYEKLVPHLKATTFRAGDIVYADDTAGYVHFLSRGAASVAVSGADDAHLELCLIGSEGLIGVRAICLHNRFDLRCTMLSAGDGFKLPVDVFQKLFYECRTLARLALLQLETRTLETASTALCNQSHPIEKRFSRRLLTLADRLGSKRLATTQESIGIALNVHRPSVSVASKKLQDAGIISCKRGQITILEQQQLEKQSCDCYFITKEIMDNYRAQALENKKL